MFYHRMSRDQLDKVCEKTILGLVLGVLVFAPLALGGLGAWQFLVIEGLTALAMMVWAVRLWVSHSPKFLFPPLCWAVLAFMLYTAIRWWSADLEYVARGELIRVCIYGALFFLILNNLHRQESVQIIAFTLLFLAMGLCFYAGWQFMSKTAHVWSIPTRYPGRGSGTFIYPNHFAGFLEMLLPIALAYVLMGRLGHLTKIVLAYIACVILAGIIVTMSRGGWAVTGISLVVFCLVLLTQRDHRFQAGLMLGVILITGLLILPRTQLFQHRVAEVTQSGKADNLRFSLWQPAIQMWRDNFWLGLGPAHFDFRFGQYRPPEVQIRPDYAHNDYLNTLADYGLIGALIIGAAVALLYYGILQSWRAVRGGKDDFKRLRSNKFSFLIGASVGLFAILLHSLVDFNMHMPANAIVAVTLMALLASHWRFETERYWFRAHAGAKVITTICLLGLIGGFAFAGTRAARREYWHRLADQAATQTNPFNLRRIAALEKAFAAEPHDFELSLEIAQCYRLRSWRGNDDYVPLAQKAMAWYRRGMVLDKYEPMNPLGYGLCLDWIGDAVPTNKDSGAYYWQANDLDLNNSYVMAYTGWHYIEIGDWVAARTWLQRSERFQWLENLNPVAFQYLPVVEKTINDRAQRNK